MVATTVSRRASASRRVWFVEGVTWAFVSRSQRMQHADGPAHVETLSQPPRARRPRMEPDPLRLVPRPQGPNRIGRHRRWRWDLGQGPTVRPPEPQRVVGQSLELISLLVDRAMVAATEQREICQGSRAALRPVAHVMALPDPHVAAREATAPVAMQQRPPQGWRNRPGPGPDLHQPPFGLVTHHHRLASQARRRDVSAETWLPSSSTDWPGCSGSARTAASTWTTTWYRSPGAPGSSSWCSAVSASNASASACCCARVGGSAAGSAAGGTGRPAARFRW